MAVEIAEVADIAVAAEAAVVAVGTYKQAVAHELV